MLPLINASWWQYFPSWLWHLNLFLGEHFHTPKEQCVMWKIQEEKMKAPWSTSLSVHRKFVEIISEMIDINIYCFNNSSRELGSASAYYINLPQVRGSPRTFSWQGKKCKYLNPKNANSSKSTSLVLSSDAYIVLKSVQKWKRKLHRRKLICSCFAWDSQQPEHALRTRRPTSARIQLKHVLLIKFFMHKRKRINLKS